MDLNNKVNVLDWSIQLILQILVLKHNIQFFPQIISSTYLRSNSICLRFLLNCMKIKYETNSFGSGIVVVFAAVTIICIGTAWWPYRYVSVGVCIDTVLIQTVSSQPYNIHLSKLETKITFQDFVYILQVWVKRKTNMVLFNT